MLIVLRTMPHFICICTLGILNSLMAWPHKSRLLHPWYSYAFKHCLCPLIIAWLCFTQQSPYIWSRASFLVSALGPQNPVGRPGVALAAATVWLCKAISRKSSQSLKFLAGSNADALLSNNLSWYKVPFSTAEVTLYSCFQIAYNIIYYFMAVINIPYLVICK